MTSLTVGGIIQHGALTGLKNAASLLGAVGLWLLTLWIPYLNVGTTIGLLGLVAAMSKGEVISPTEIFRADYRKQMGEFFLVQAFLSVGVAIGVAFLIIPGMVIGLAWSLAPLLVIDQSMNPTQALQESNNLTSGKKATMFFGLFLTYAGSLSVVMLLSRLMGKLHFVLGALFMLAGLVVVVAVVMGAQAVIYGTLTGKAPARTVEVKNGPVIGGTVGAIVASALFMSLLSPSRHAYEPYRYTPPTMPSSDNSLAPAHDNDGLDLTEPTPHPRVSPALADDSKPPQKNVASATKPGRRHTH